MLKNVVVFCVTVALGALAVAVPGIIIILTSN